MTDAANRILEGALKLNEHERARVAAELLASLDTFDENVEEAWAREIERRAANARVSDAEETDWREALDEIERAALSK